MDPLLVFARATHYASALLVLGELIFALVIARPPREAPTSAPYGEHYRRLLRVGGASLAIAFASSIVWLALLASSMSGLPLDRALNLNTLGLVVFRTEFGRVFLLRLALAAGVGAALLSIRRSRNARVRGAAALAALIAAVGYVAALAWSGHAAAGLDPEREIHLGSDALHLLAAGAWLGALPALISALRRPSFTDAARVTWRFSVVGAVSVTGLALSGIVNAWLLVGSFDALFGTDYGCVVCAKIVLFALMIVLALVNRLRWTPRLAEASGKPREALRRNAIVETALGLIVLILVAMLGTMVPAAHQRHHHHAEPSPPTTLGLDSRLRPCQSPARAAGVECLKDDRAHAT
jgi:putative copper resistance protein D